MRTFIVIFLLFLLEAPVHAGPSRDLWIPQARTLPEGTSSLEMQQTFVVSKTQETRNAQAASWGASAGLVDWNRISVEAGLDWTEPSYGVSAAAVSAHLTTAWGRVEEDGWAVAAGLKDYGFDAAKNDYNIFFGVFQNQLGDDWQIQVGGYAGNAKTLQAQGEGNGLLLGLWSRLNRHATLGVEWQSGYNAFGYAFTGLSWLVRDGVIATAGYGIPNSREIYRDWGLLRLTVGL